MDEQKIVKNRELSIWEALIPVFALIGMLAYNVFVFGDDAISGSNQFILLLGGGVAALVGYFNKVKFETMLDNVGSNLKSVSSAIIILLLVGSLAASWLISGIIPAMIYYGLQLINPVIFLPATVIIAAIISVATGSSWTTSATVGIALIAIGKAIGLPVGMVAGAVISGAYFGDKMSPMSDTTNLASAISGAPLMSHIRYMMYTTVPSIVITIVVFTILSLTYDTSAIVGKEVLLGSIKESFNISPWLFVVPVVIIAMIIRKVQPIIALLLGSLLGLLFALIFQPNLIAQLSGATHLGISENYMVLMDAATRGLTVETSNAQLNDLFSSGGMKGMLGTIWLIITAMIFGGIMESIGALSRISQALLSMAKSVFGLFASTVASCLALNITASDQYLAIVVPGKMFKQAFDDKDLAPENLSRSLEDSGTVTSVLIPWNTCGAYQSAALQVDVVEYFAFAIFNYLSPLMTLIFAAFRIKLKQKKHNT